MSRDHVAEIRAALGSATKLCRSLELDRGAKRQAGDGLMILCPVHAERSPSCSVRTVGGSVAVKCWGCDWTGDALTLVAAARGLDLRSDFKSVLIEAAQLAGLHGTADEIATGETAEDAQRRREARFQAREEAPPEPVRDWVPTAELEALWRDSGPVSDDPDASGTLVGRRIDPLEVDRLALACCFRRNIARDRLPRWAAYQHQTWRDTGHRMLIRAYDHEGVWRSVRAWRVRDGTSPKRLPPAGFRAAGIVLANRLGVALLKGLPTPRKVVCCEGEPDWTVRSIVTPELPILGVLSGSWHEGFAQRIPWGSEVIIRTHNDQAGDRYAAKILETIRDRARVYRVVEETEAAS